MTEIELRKMLQWAEGKIVEGKEPPWAWYRFMQLRDALEHIVGGCPPIEGHSVSNTAKPGSMFRLKVVD